MGDLPAQLALPASPIRGFRVSRVSIADRHHLDRDLTL